MYSVYSVYSAAYICREVNGCFEVVHQVPHKLSVSSKHSQLNRIPAILQSKEQRGKTQATPVQMMNTQNLNKLFNAYNMHTLRMQTDKLEWAYM